MGYIYKIQNLIDNKIYIGQTIQDIDIRWKQHKNQNSNCRYLKNAFNKYSINNFKFEIICICFDEDLDKNEIEYMKKYNSIVPNGYNLREGGNSGKHNQLTKDKISKALTGRIPVYKNGVNPNIGKKHIKETKYKIRIALLGMKKSKETCEKLALIGRKKVIQYDINNNIISVFNSGKEAAEKNNTTKAAISMVCNGKRIQNKGYKYEYESDEFGNLLDKIKNLKIKKK